MKVAFVVEHCHKKGGHERYVAELAEYMSLRHEVHVFTNSWEGIGGQVIFHRVPMAKKPTLLMLWSFKRNAYRLIKQHGLFDIVHSQGSNSLIQNIVTNHTSQKARLAAMIPLGQSDRSLAGRIHDRLFWSYVINAEAKLYSAKTSNRVIAVSQGVRREMLKYYSISPANIQVIVNGVDLERFNHCHRAERRGRWRSRHGFAPSDFIMLFVGGDWERKRLDIAIGSLSFIDRPDVKLAVVGSWHREPIYRELSASLGLGTRVFFCGPSTVPEEAYSGSDLFVFPSAYEACSLSVLEAMASGLPIIMPPINGSDEQLHEGKNGYFIEHNPRSVADKISLLTKDPQLATYMGRHSRAMAEQYSWRNCAEHTEQLYKMAVPILW